MTQEPKNERTRPSTGSDEQTRAGSYFVSNYPPFSYWKSEHTAVVRERLRQSPEPGVPFGLYAHIPFCRKRCHFCYFRVYTDNDAQRVRRYVDALNEEARLYSEQPLVAGRHPLFVYFGGGTPSYLSVEQLEQLFTGLQRHFPWDEAREVTFECEPGTLQETKIRALRSLGVTRLSIGVENFDPEILELNNRAHRAKEIHKAYGLARDAGFPQINIDLIAGMVGETEENWARCVDEVVAMAPESVTIYQMEIPHNTTIYRQMRDGGSEIAPVADWPTKRRWVEEAFARLESAGYHIGSAYTACKSPDVQFLYRDSLWHGADMLGLGVASFSHLGGMHAQNLHHLDPYLESVERGELPLHRGLPLSQDESLIRQFVLQLKLGRIATGYFLDAFGVDVRDRFGDVLSQHERGGFLSFENGDIVLSRAGLMQVDRLLHDFFLAEHAASA